MPASPAEICEPRKVTRRASLRDERAGRPGEKPHRQARNAPARFRARSVLAYDKEVSVASPFLKIICEAFALMPRARQPVYAQAWLLAFGANPHNRRLIAHGHQSIMAVHRWASAWRERFIGHNRRRAAYLAISALSA